MEACSVCINKKSSLILKKAFDCWALDFTKMASHQNQMPKVQEMHAQTGGSVLDATDVKLYKYLFNVFFIIPSKFY